MDKMKWWEDSVDELGVGLAIGAVAVFAIIYMGAGAAAIASSAITAMGMYLVGKPNKK